jgi:hypothetical protein
MRILVEGEKYNLENLLEVFDDPKFFIQEGALGIINCVGYYHSFSKNALVYILPKVFIKDQTIFGYDPKELFNLDIKKEYKHSEENLWIRQLLIYFYNSLAEFRQRYKSSSLIEYSEVFELNTNLGLSEYSYLDLLLSFINFYKKNKNTILYHHIECTSNRANKAKWEKTIRKSIPIFSGYSPIYVEIKNKNKAVNDEEELLCYYFSILNHFKKEHDLPITIDKSFKILSGSQFEKLQRTGLSKLRKIKHRYFSDTLKRMFRLCELYFSKTDFSSPLRKREEFISIRNYNIVFEDMIDKLFSEAIYNKSVDEISLEKLKHNSDGKIIDHIFDYKSLIDNTNIFYIGDSKYYKPSNQAGRLTTYKQFTYAKNVIQFNIDLLNNDNSYENVRYRDAMTEGYNISPNFFIYGHLYDKADFDNSNLEFQGKPHLSYHFKERLFDRDTLFVLQYRINFLFVLKSYTSLNYQLIQNFRKITKKEFRDKFITFFNSSKDCEFTLFEKTFEIEENLSLFVNENFKILNGKSIVIHKNTLLVAIHNEDMDLLSHLTGFEIKTLS